MVIELYGMPQLGNCWTVKKIQISMRLLLVVVEKNDIIMRHVGGPHLKPPKFEHIFVAVITFFPFLLCKYF